MSDLSQAAREAWDAALEGAASVTISQVRESVKEQFPDLVELEKEHLFDIALDRILKGFARTEALSVTYQASLFGFPAIIAVPVSPDSDEDEEGYIYMKATNARYDALSAGRHIRAKNVLHAVEKLDAYDSSLAAVEPYMKGTDLTLGEALRFFS